jgi:hypothetical protein
MGFVINYSFDSTVTSLPATLRNEYEAAVAAACQYYEQVFNNNITVNILFSWGTEDGNTITGNTVGENNATGVLENYTTIKNALSNRVLGLGLTGSDPGDSLTAVNTLPSSDPAPGGNGTYNVSNPEAKALGIAPSYNNSTNANHYDGYVGLNSSDSYSFDPSDRAVSGDFDAIGTLEHEISEVLGRYDPLGQTGATVDGNPEQIWRGQYSILDLFHYDSSGVRSMNLSGTKPFSTAAYFSIDGSHYLEEYNNLSVASGDLGDWLPSIQGDSYGDQHTDTVTGVTPTDLREDNVIGWDRAPATINDFTGDGVSDILYYNHTTGDVGYYAMNGSLLGWKDIGPSSTAYSVVGTGDFNDDGTADVLFRSSTTGDIGFYAMSNGGEPSGTAATEGNNASGKSTGWVDIGASSTAYSVVGTGRFEVGNGDDNTSDVLFRDNATGDTGFYNIVNGANTGWVDIGGSSTAYSVVGVGDFMGDATDDVLFRNNATGDTGFYNIVDGSNEGWVDIGASSTAYSAVGVGDFFDNGTDDILFRDNATGDTGFYEIINGVNTGWHDIGASSTAYSVVATGDYYGNGTSDILFRDNATGDTGFYAISNGVNTGWHDIGASSTAYHVAS